MTPKTADAANPDLIDGDWIVRFEPRTLDDIRAIVQPSPENERRFAAARRVSEINLGLYRTLFQPFVQAFASTQTAEWLHKLNPSELPYELFSDRNPLMQQIAQLAEQVREQRQPASPDNPLLQVQAMISDGIIAALDGYRDLRDRSMEQIFLGIYSSPLLQALVGLRASDEPPRRRPGLEPERIAFIQQRIAELKARLAEGGLREAAIRGLVYIGMAGPGVDERAFEALRQMRAAHGGLTLAEFKQVLREQFFALMLDRDGALAAIPKMLPADTAARAEALGKIRRVVSAVGEAHWRTRRAAGADRTTVPGRRTDRTGCEQSRLIATEKRTVFMDRKHEKYERLIARCKALTPVPTAVAHPCDESSLKGAVEAAELGILQPILVGPRARIEAVAAQFQLDISGYEIVDAPHSHAAADEAVRLTREGKAEMRVGFLTTTGWSKLPCSGCATKPPCTQLASSYSPKNSLCRSYKSYTKPFMG